MSNTIPFMRTHPSATPPVRSTLDASGVDLFACLPDGDVTIQPGSLAVIDIGIAVEIPSGYEGQVRPRSGHAAKNGIMVLTGTIDSDYRGSIKAIVFNHGDRTFTVTHAMRIAQLIVAPVIKPVFEEYLTLSKTARGSGGLGSTD